MNYLACFLDRRYLSPKNGGLGLFELKSFISALKCSWIKRAISKNIDNWRYDLKSLAPGGDISLIHTYDVKKTDQPILYNLANAFVEFRNALCKKNSNFKKSPIFLNPNFVRSGLDGEQLDIPFFSREIYNNCTVPIRKLTFEDCFRDGAFKTIQEFTEMELSLNGTVWMRLRGAMTHAKSSFSDQIRKPDCTDASDFLTTFKKGSKKFRDIICYNPNADTDRLELRTVITYAELTNTLIPDPESLGTILGTWNLSFLSNEVREFIFKERNNCLPLNNRAAHFVQNLSDKCSFCRIINPDTNTRENFSHLFFDCPISNLVLNGFIRLSGIRVLGNDPNIRNIYWNGIIQNSLNKELLLIFELFRYCVWKSKIRRTVPRARTILYFLSNILSTIFSIKPEIETKIRNNLICAPLLQALG